MTSYPIRLPTFGSSTKRLKLPNPMVILGIVVALVVVGVGVRACMPKKAADPYRFGSVTRGDLTRSVSASGTLQALVTVQVGSQVSGLVKEVLVDFNSNVDAGQVLAIIDPQTFEQQVGQANADLSASAATLRQQQAAMVQAQAQAQVDLNNYNRTKTMYAQGWASSQAMDTAEATYKRSAAGVDVARAVVGTQQARISQSQASLKNAQINLTRTKILSPITGVVVSRQVDPGQTVQSSFQAATLFQIAQDLSKLQVKILVDEADIGQIRKARP